MGVLDKLEGVTTPKKKQSYKDIHGTTRVGDALRWLKEAGKNVAPELLTIASKATGIGGLDYLAQQIKGDTVLSQEDKAYALKQLDLDMVEAQEITKRWEADMKSDSWLSKNVRPMILVFVIFITMLIIILESSVSGFVVKEHWINLLMAIDVTALGGYFTLRQFGENAKFKYGK